MSQDTLQKIYNKTQSGSNDPLFLLTPQLLTTELITSLNEKGELEDIFPHIQNYKVDNSKLNRSIEIDGIP